MGIRGLAIAGSILASVISTHAKAAGTTELTWAIPSFPPAYIEQDNTLTGYAAETQKWLMARLPQYKHLMKKVPLARLLAEMRSEELRCSLTLIPTRERRDYIYFANPILISLPPSVVVLARQLPAFQPYLNDRNEIDIDRLLADANMNTAIRLGRSYGQYVDAAIRKYRHHSNIITVGSDEKFIQLLEMGRLDWIMYLPAEAEFHHRKAEYKNEIISLPIARMTPLITATLGCSKNEAGKQVIDAVNAILKDYPDMPWTQFYQAWLPEKDRLRYQQILKTITTATLSQINPPS
ncbi:transporter substrate-binding domain-containing protein [Thalassospira mesophila]|uniref:transporter substrate-binding domain-containing protein n=1 Tax=Thalassospira mesophila TaxID=1293891 RepID=UPI000A1E862F|nr:transporter substrate-binding domain-containing protein [Thalassospira mesophila]